VIDTPAANSCREPLAQLLADLRLCAAATNLDDGGKSVALESAADLPDHLFRETERLRELPKVHPRVGRQPHEDRVTSADVVLLVLPDEDSADRDLPLVAAFDHAPAAREPPHSHWKLTVYLWQHGRG
jgi:hypothetical protein